MSKLPATGITLPPGHYDRAGVLLETDIPVEVSQMYAQVGDRLIVAGDPARAGIIIAVPHEDGSPPYIVRWLTNGHIAMVSPGEFARVIPAGHQNGPSAGRLLSTGG